jgi:8-oxo-dGTP diphosphatase
MVRHLRPEKYDFWVAPGGGVKEGESLEQAAAREVREETGLDVTVSKLLYIEELINPECRFVKFWFAANFDGGSIDTSHPDTVAEHIVQAAWLAREDFSSRVVFPLVLESQYWADREAGFPAVIRLPLRHMEFW